MRSKKTILLPKHQAIMQELGQNIKLARLRRKLTTVQVAERANIARSTLYLIESGDPTVSFGSYFNVVRIFGLEMDFIKLAADDVLGRKLQDLELLCKPEKGGLDYSIFGKITLSLKRGSYKKDSEVEKIIGCSYEELVIYLENNYYGFKVGEQNLDIDHIIPISKAITQEDVYKLNNYRNLQLLPAPYNRNIKSDKEWDEDHFRIWYNTYE